MTTSGDRASRPAPLRTMAQFGALIRDTRVAHGWAQGELAERAHVGRQWLVSVEQGRHTRAEIGMVLRVLDALGVELFAHREEATTSTLDDPTPGRRVDLDALLNDLAARDG